MAEPRPLNTEHRPVKLRVEDYLLLDREGAFDAYTKTELLDGEILYMNAQHRPHARLKSQLFLAISHALKSTGSPFDAIVEASIAMPDHSVPEPDIVLTSEPDGEGLIPLPSVALVIEVADTTLTTDMTVKARLYAAAAIPEYWVADVNGRMLHQMWAPQAMGYASVRRVPFGDRVTSESIAGLEIVTPPR